MSKFNVGDRVRVVYGRFKGVETVVLTVSPALETKKYWKRGDLIYQVDLPASGKPEQRGWGPADSLEPIYDGHETGSWEAMRDLWIPQGVSA